MNFTGKKVLFTVLLALVFFTALLFLEPLFFIERFEEERFDEEFIENLKLDLYCPVFLEERVFITNNLARYCNDSELNSEGVKIELIEKEFLKNGKAVGIIKADFEKSEPEVFLIGVAKPEGHFTTRKVNGDFNNSSFLDGFFKIEILVGEDTVVEKYSLTEAGFLRVFDQWTERSSSTHGFSLKIPEGWTAKLSRSEIIFYSQTGEEAVRINVNQEEGDFQKGSYFYRFSSDPVYEKALEEMIDSFGFKEIDELPDYRYFQDELTDYLKINTVTGKLGFYENGDLKENFEMLAAIDPATWGGTPSGLYEVISKEGLRFSTTTSVYMPFSVRFYGKYLIHGQPFYPGGAPFYSRISGGCIRVETEKMRRLYDFLEAGLPVLSITAQQDGFEPEEKSLEKPPEVSAESFLVADLDSGKVFLDKNPEDRHHISSIVKMLTAVVVAEHMGTTSSIRASDYMLKEDNSRITPNRSYRMVDVLAPLLIESSDDAARFLSHYLGRDWTMKRLKEKTDQIGMHNTQLVDVTGRDEENLASARDLYYLAYYLNHTRIPILNISRGVWAPGINYHVFPGLENKNIFYEKDDFLGGKTGLNGGSASGFYIFKMKMGGVERRVAFIALNSSGKDELTRDILNLKEWLTFSIKK